MHNLQHEFCDIPAEGKTVTSNRALAHVWHALFLLVLTASGAWAQQYPARPVLIVAPFSAGGDSDLAARNLAAVLPKYIKLGKSLGIVLK